MATTNAEKRAKTFKRKAKRTASKYAVITGVVIGIFLAMLAVNGLNNFYSRYELYFRSPLQNPLVFHEKILPMPTKMPPPTSIPTPHESPKKAAQGESKATIVANSKYPDFIDHIWEHESGRGKNTSGLNGYCIARGMTNEFGFYPQGKHCFESFAQSVQRLEKWRENEAKGLTDSQALCYYNGAGKVNRCAYLTYNFRSMN